MSHKELSIEERVAKLIESFPSTTVQVRNGRAEGVWMLGQNYRRAWNFHGAYLQGYLARVNAMFADFSPADTVHLFAGHVPPGEWLRVDIFDRLGTPDSNFVQADIGDGGHAPRMESKRFANRKLFLADPPYHEKDCRVYGCSPIDRRRCLSEIARVAERGAYLVWLDTYEPLTRKEEWTWIGFFALRVCNSHQLRGVWIYQRT